MWRRRMEPPLNMSDVKVVLLGSTGSGKSASGNTIIGGDRKTFIEDYSADSETRICTPGQTKVDGRTITVIDTVGLSDSVIKKNKGVQNKVEQIFECTRHGVDVFLLVIKLGDKFTDEVTTAVKWIQDNFGAEVLRHTLVLFTHGDQIHEPIEDYLGESETLRLVVDQCSGGFHVFNNKDKDPSQVTELLKKINTLREKNVYRRYTEQDYKTIQDKLLLKKCVIAAAAAGVLAVFMRAVGIHPGKAAVVGAVVGFGLYCVFDEVQRERERNKKAGYNTLVIKPGK